MAGTDAALLDDHGEQEYRKALNSATRMLARRMHARRELRTKLLARFETETVERVIGRLIELRYLNDVEFAREYARQRFERSPRSALSVAVELEGRGVGRVDAELAVAGTMEDEGLSDESLAGRAARKKLAALGGDITDERTRTKIFAFLASRGFSREVARRIVLDGLEPE
jgi:regulatory protein